MTETLGAPECEQNADAGGPAELVISRGYLARNLDVANAYGLSAGLETIMERMRARKDCPLWLLEKLDDMLQRSNCLIRPLVEHRDELPPDPRDVRGYMETMLSRRA